MSKSDPQMIASGYERNRLDRYWTHPWMTNELFRLVGKRYIPTYVWEPAAGRGDMSQAIIDNGHFCYSTDIDMSEYAADRPGGSHERSFLDEYELPVYWDNHDQGLSTPVGAIVTNPPYNDPWKGIADDFIRHGLSFFDDGIDFMAMLLRSEFRSAKGRRDMFGSCDHYLGEIVLTTRPRWDYGDPDAPEKASPRHNFSWFMWKRDWSKHGNYAPMQLFSYMPKGFTQDRKP